MKKSPDGAAVQKYQKQILKKQYLHYWLSPEWPRVSTDMEDQSEDHFGELEC